MKKSLITISLTCLALISACGKKEDASQTTNQPNQSATTTIMKSFSNDVDGFKDFKFGMLPLDLLKIKGCDEPVGSKLSAIDGNIESLKKQLNDSIDQGVTDEAVLDKIKAELDFYKGTDKNKILASEKFECKSTFLGEDVTVYVKFNNESHKAESFMTETNLDNEKFKTALPALSEKYSLNSKPSDEEMANFNASTNGTLQWVFADGQVVAGAARIPAKLNLLGIPMQVLTVEYFDKSVATAKEHQATAKAKDI